MAGCFTATRTGNTCEFFGVTVLQFLASLEKMICSNTAVAVVSLLFLFFSSHEVSATNPAFLSKGTIYLVNNQGKETAIGSIEIGEPIDGNAGFNVSIDNNAFSEHFLSMRPFRCLQGELEWFCYLPYPYSLRNTISVDDLSDLEYQLLFLRKTPSEFGIDAWNGLYFKLTLQDDGIFNGVLLEGDLNSLQSPPDEEYAKPIELDEFIEASRDKRLYPSIIIR